MSRNDLCAEHRAIDARIPLHPEDPPMWGHVLSDEHEQAMTVAHWVLTREPA